MNIERIIYEWDFNPPIILAAAILVYIFYLLSGFKYRKNTFCFAIAMFLFLMVTCSPLNYLGMHFYFSAHMISHVILLLICGPLMIISIPSDAKVQNSKFLATVSSFFYYHTYIAWLSGIGIMWLLHVPAVFDSSLSHMHSAFSIMPLLHSGSMLLAGMLFSWPLFGPVDRYHIHPLAGIMYLFTACISCSILGLLITFAPLTTYHHYMQMNTLTDTSNPLNISLAADQQAAGLIMWVPCCLVYIAGCIYLLQKWFSTQDEKHSTKLINLNSLTESDD